MAAARRIQTLEDVCLAGQVAASANFKKNALGDKSNWKTRPARNTVNWKNKQSLMARRMAKALFMMKMQLNFHPRRPRTSMINNPLENPSPCKPLQKGLETLTIIGHR